MPDEEAEQNLVVNTIDDLAGEGHVPNERRKLGDFRPTNMPLSQYEIERDEAKDVKHKGWAPRTTENVGDLTPLPEKPAQP